MHIRGEVLVLFTLQQTIEKVLQTVLILKSIEIFSHLTKSTNLVTPYESRESASTACDFRFICIVIKCKLYYTIWERF